MLAQEEGHDSRYGSQYRDQQAGHGMDCRDRLAASVVAHAHEPDSGDKLSHGFVRGKEIHDDHLD